MANKTLGELIAGVGAVAAIAFGTYLWDANPRYQTLMDAVAAKNTAQQEFTVANGRMNNFNRKVQESSNWYQVASSNIDPAKNALNLAETKYERELISAQTQANTKEADKANPISNEGSEMKGLESLVVDFRAKLASAESSRDNAFPSYRAAENLLKNTDKSVNEKRSELNEAISSRDAQKDKYDAANEHLQKLTNLANTTKSSLDDEMASMYNAGEDKDSKLIKLNDLQKSQKKGVKPRDSLWKMVKAAYILAHGNIPSNNQILSFVNDVAEANNMMTIQKFDKYVKQKYSHINLDGINYSRLQIQGNPHRMHPGQVIDLSGILKDAIANSAKTLAESETAYKTSFDNVLSLEERFAALGADQSNAKAAFNLQSTAYSNAVQAVSETSVKLAALEDRLTGSKESYDAAKSAYEAAKSAADALTAEFESAKTKRDSFVHVYVSSRAQTKSLTASNQALEEAREKFAKAQSHYLRAKIVDLETARVELEAANKNQSDFKPKYEQKDQANRTAISNYSQAYNLAPSKQGIIAGYSGLIGGILAVLGGVGMALYGRRRDNIPDGTPGGNGPPTPTSSGNGNGEIGDVVGPNVAGQESTESRTSAYHANNVTAIDLGHSIRYAALKNNREVESRYNSRHKRPNFHFASDLQETFNTLYDSGGRITMSAKDAADKFGVSISTIYRRTRRIASLLEDNTLTYRDNSKNVYSVLEKVASPSVVVPAPIVIRQILAA